MMAENYSWPNVMSKLPVSDRIYDDEIDLLSLIETVWTGKWKIASIIAISLLTVFGFNIIKPNKTFIAETEIKPITSFEHVKYSLFNSSLKKFELTEKDEVDITKEKKAGTKGNFFEITQEYLLDLYLENLEEGSLLENGIHKFNLINKDDFDNEEDYKEAVQKFASEIKILKPMKEKNVIRLNHILRAEYTDRGKWKNLLTFVNGEANRKVKAAIINRFSTMVSVQNQIKEFAIKDIDIKIDNVKKDYDRQTKDRLAFLIEQAAIARKLEIEKNTIASQRFNTQNTFVTNVRTDAPFYLRGYLAIEEEINQIKNRKEKNSFNKALFKLEQEKRDLKQDETTARALDLFNKTPLNQTDFKASLVRVATTEYEVENKSNLYYALAIVLGGIIGVVYVLMANAFKNRRTLLTNS